MRELFLFEMRVNTIEFTTPQWVQALTSIGTFCVAVAVGVVAYLQWRTNQNKLKLDLFEKRYAVYLATAKCLGSIFKEGTATDENLQNLHIAIGPAKFLFPGDINAFIDEFYGHAMGLLVTTSGLKDLPSGPERKQLMQEHNDHLTWFLNKGDVMVEKFKPVLQLNH